MKTIKTLFRIIVLAIFAWLCASWVDVVSHNLSDCAYQPWNIFSIIWGGVVC